MMPRKGPCQKFRKFPGEIFRAMQSFPSLERDFGVGETLNLRSKNSIIIFSQQCHLEPSPCLVKRFLTHPFILYINEHVHQCVHVQYLRSLFTCRNRPPSASGRKNSFGNARPIGTGESYALSEKMGTNYLSTGSADNLKIF